MHEQTKTAARRLQRHVHRCDDWTDRHQHWHVKSGNNYVDVWKMKGVWKCNQMVLKPKGFIPVCGYFKGDKQKPYCKHTLACELYEGDRNVDS